MSGAKHTPGPWRRDNSETRHRLCHVLGPEIPDGSGAYDSHTIAHIYHQGSHDEAKANAALIIAAPALLEALECVRQYGADTLSGRTDGPDDRDWQRAAVVEMTRRARAALAQARGEDVGS